MTSPAPITQALLLAYVDGQLGDAERGQVEVYLRDNPAAAAEVAAWQRQDEAIAALFAPVNEALPARLDPRLIGKGRSSAPEWLRHAAAAVLLLSIGSGAGWLANDLVPASSGPTLLGEAATAHLLYTREVRHAVEVTAGEGEHLQSWLSKRLDHPLTIPDLREAGFALLGGRLLPATQGPAAQFMYENGAGERLTLYVVGSSESGRGELRFSKLDDLDAVAWEDGGISCALVGNLAPEALKRLAETAYEQLEG